jgi:hypothetical protein
LSPRPWEEVRPTLLDLEQAHAPIRMLHCNLLNGAIWLVLIGLAVLRCDPVALALTLGPLLLLTLLNALPSPFARWITAQLPGTFYPFMLFGTAGLLDHQRSGLVCPNCCTAAMLASSMPTLLADGRAEPNRCLPRAADEDEEVPF